MKILYAFSGEGSGHSSRAKVVIKHLLSKNHEIRLATYGRGIENFKNIYPVFELIGLTIITVDNQVSKSKTLAHNLSTVPQAQQKLNAFKKEIFEDFKPDCVITDFEPISAYLANFYKIPLISLDNQHSLRYMEYKYPSELMSSALLTENIIRTMIPRPCFSIITSFYEKPLKNNRSYITPPILREEIINTNTKKDNHVLVYLTQGYDSLIKMLQSFKREKFIIYGQSEKTDDQHMQFKSPSASEFLKDLSSAKAVIATSGFTLLSEAFYLKIPYLSVPMKGQFEQEFNAIISEELGYGINMNTLDHYKIAAFLYLLPEFEENLNAYQGNGNQKVFDKLDELLADNMKILKEYHHKRTINFVFESLLNFKKDEPLNQ